MGLFVFHVLYDHRGFNVNRGVQFCLPLFVGLHLKEQSPAFHPSILSRLLIFSARVWFLFIIKPIKMKLLTHSAGGAVAEVKVITCLGLSPR